MKVLAPIFYICVAGVLVSFGGSIYTGVRIHQEKSRPQPTVFPTPAMDQASGQGSGQGSQMGSSISAPPAAAPAPGALPTPAR
jgi:hypothetical protein